MSDEKQAIAERVHQACIRAAREAYEDAGIQGLCAAGRWEYALSAVEKIDLAAIVGATGDEVGTRKKGSAPTRG